MSWEMSFLLHDTELLTLCRRQRLQPPAFLALKWQEEPFGSSRSRRAAASDSRGHRDRQQTRQLRKDLTLLFSIINEQQSKQIRTEGGWGLPVCCSAAREYTRPSHQMLHTHKPFKVWLCKAYLSFLYAKKPLRVEGAERHCGSIEGFTDASICGWNNESRDI